MEDRTASPQSVNLELPHDSAMPLLATFQDESEAWAWTDMCTLVFTAALHMVVVTGNKSNVHQQTHRHTKHSMYVQPENRMTLCYSVDDLQGKYTSEICHAQNDSHCLIPLIGGAKESS